jgi:hypothetical protein
LLVARRCDEWRGAILVLVLVVLVVETPNNDDGFAQKAFVVTSKKKNRNHIRFFMVDCNILIIR